VLPTLPMLTLLAAVGLNGMLPSDSRSLLFPLSELDVDHQSSEILKKTDDVSISSHSHGRLYAFLIR
jgi:hypothetical protein